MNEFDDLCKDLRAEIEGVKAKVLPLKNDHLGEVGANLTLAYRHLEDARMRLGKAIQAAGDGVSIYDK